MLYTVANPGWSPGRPLCTAAERGGLCRSRAEAEAEAEARIGAAAGRRLLAVALQYDGARGRVVSEGAPARAPGGIWSAPAVVDQGGGVTVLAEVPARLVRPVGPPERRAHPGILRLVARPHVAIAPATTTDGAASAAREGTGSRPHWRGPARRATAPLPRGPCPPRPDPRGLVAPRLWPRPRSSCAATA